MTYKERFMRTGAPASLLMAAALALAGAGRLAGQDFERTFGRENNERGRVVQQTQDGGYIAAGYTQDPATLAARAYVIRMSPDGGAIWERRFRIGGGVQTFGMDLTQLANGEHILVGTYESQPVCSTGCAEHIYAIRFADNGDLIWYKTYGNNGVRQFATSVVETQVPIPNPDDVGNLVIGGYTIDDLGERHGLLARLWGNGDIRWVTEYDANPGVTNDNELMSVDETQAGASAGDIVATGFSNFGATSYDVWVLRVDGASGRIIAAPQGSAGFSTTAADRGYSIRELRLGANPGDLVIAGESFGRAGTTNSEVLMMQTRPGPCDPKGHRGAQFLGDGRDRENYARCVREIADPTLGTIGDVMVTGASFTTTFGTTLDLFLQQFAQGTMAQVGPHRVYGGRDTDIGLGLGELSSGFGTAGYIVTGLTASNPPAPGGHREDLYIVRTDAALRSCTQRTAAVTSTKTTLAMKCLATTLTNPQWQVICSATSGTLGWEFDLCR